MNRIILASLFAVATFVTTSGTAHAAPQKKGKAAATSSAKKSNAQSQSSQSQSSQLNFIRKNNSNFFFGSQHHNCYPRAYCGWSNYCWYPQYGCYCYYCPQTCVWYYWSAAFCQYVPITYITHYRPTCIGIVPVQGVYSTLVQPGIGLPPGASALPATGGPGGIQPMTLPKN